MSAQFAALCSDRAAAMRTPLVIVLARATRATRPNCRVAAQIKGPGCSDAPGPFAFYVLLQPATPQSGGRRAHACNDQADAKQPQGTEWLALRAVANSVSRRDCGTKHIEGDRHVAIRQRGSCSRTPVSRQRKCGSETGSCFLGRRGQAYGPIQAVCRACRRVGAGPAGRGRRGAPASSPRRLWGERRRSRRAARRGGLLRRWSCGVPRRVLTRTSTREAEHQWQAFRRIGKACRAPATRLRRPTAVRGMASGAAHVLVGAEIASMTIAQGASPRCSNTGSNVHEMATTMPSRPGLPSGTSSAGGWARR
jgi:hypothetical protein